MPAAYPASPAPHAPLNFKQPGGALKHRESPAPSFEPGAQSRAPKPRTPRTDTSISPPSRSQPIEGASSTSVGTGRGSTAEAPRPRGPAPGRPLLPTQALPQPPLVCSPLRAPFSPGDPAGASSFRLMGAGGGDALDKDAAPGPGGGQGFAPPVRSLRQRPFGRRRGTAPRRFHPLSRDPSCGKQPRGQRVPEVSRANTGARLRVGNVQPGTRDSALAPGGRLTPRPPSILEGGFINVCFLGANEFSAECPAPSGSAGCAPCSERPALTAAAPQAPGRLSPARPSSTRFVSHHRSGCLPSSAAAIWAISAPWLPGCAQARAPEFKGASLEDQSPLPSSPLSHPHPRRHHSSPLAQAQRAA